MKGPISEFACVGSPRPSARAAGDLAGRLPEEPGAPAPGSARRGRETHQAQPAGRGPVPPHGAPSPAPVPFGRRHHALASFPARDAWLPLPMPVPRRESLSRFDTGVLAVSALPIFTVPGPVCRPQGPQRGLQHGRFAVGEGRRVHQHFRRSSL